MTNHAEIVERVNIASVTERIRMKKEKTQRIAELMILKQKAEARLLAISQELRRLVQK